MPNNIFNSCVDVCHIGFDRSVTFLGNTTAISQVCEKISKAFNIMFEKNAYVHWYESNSFIFKGDSSSPLPCLQFLTLQNT